MKRKRSYSTTDRKLEHSTGLFLWLSVLALVIILRTMLSHDETVCSMAYWQSNISLHLIIFACSRYYSFIRLLVSIEKSLPVTIPIKLTVFLDVPIDGMTTLQSNERMHLIQVLHRIKSKHGHIDLKIRRRHFGLKKNVLSSWVPQSVNEYAVFLEDDIEVSPLFLYLSSIYISKLHPLPPHIMGISLFNDRVSQLTGETLIVPDLVPYRLYQQAQSWGAVMSPRQWLEFTQFAATLGDEFDPNITDIEYGSNNWDKNSSWKKYLLYYMFYSGKYLVYPTFPDNKSITTHHVEPSEHFPVKPSEDRLRVELRPALLELSDLSTMIAKCKNLDWREMPVFDMSHRMIADKARDLSSFA